MKYIAQAYDLKKKLDDLRPINSEQEQKIISKFRLDWNFHSNNIEGNSLNFGETKMLLLHGVTSSGKPLKDHLEIEGHNDAIKLVEDIVKSNRPLTQNFIRELHQIIIKKPYYVDVQTIDGNKTKKLIEIGKYKSTPNHVKTTTGEIFYFATPEETPAKMTDLINWYEAELKKKDFDPVIIASSFHYKFIRIHPFDDGNGRIARILMNFILMKFHFPPVIIKTSDKTNYLNSLRKADGGVFEDFVEYIAQNLCYSLQIMIKGAKGEEIEEEDDLDKEIAVLKATYKNIKKNNDEYKTTENIQKLAKNSLKKLFEEFIAACKKFDGFYKRVEISVMNSYAMDGYKITFKCKNEFLDFITSSSLDDNILEIDFLYIFYSDEEYKAKLNISFRSKNFIIYYADCSSRFFPFKRNEIKKSYNQQLTSDEITKIIKSEKKHHLRILKEKQL